MGMVGLTYREWCDGRGEILALRDRHPNVSEELFAAGWRMYDRGDTREAREDALVLLAGCEQAARREEEGMAWG